MAASHCSRRLIRCLFKLQRNSLRVAGPIQQSSAKNLRASVMVSVKFESTPPSGCGSAGIFERGATMQPLSDWDEDYILNEVATIKESSSLEKKASDKLSKKSADKQDIAKEICAFANAGEGFLVFGMPDDGGIDGGVPEKIGNQSCDSWITAMVPKWHHPPIENCEARFLSASQHDSGRRVLIVRIPLSDRRPHWSTIENPHTAFLRVGEHSAPMGLQTLLDISSRGPTFFGAIKDVVMRRITTNQKGQTEYRASPEVRIESGPMCAEWAFEFSIEPSAGRLKFRRIYR